MMDDDEGILSVILGGAADLFLRRQDTVLQAVTKYLERVSQKLNINLNMLVNNFSVELLGINAKEVRMTIRIELQDNFGRSFDVEPDVSIVKLSHVPESLRSRINSRHGIDATPEIKAKVFQERRIWW